jgi:hypothetical protein
LQEAEMKQVLPLRDAVAAVVSVRSLPIIAMASFRRLMAREGWFVDLARMCADRAYVYECLALAHTSAEARLRRVAFDLFASYERPLALTPLH